MKRNYGIDLLRILSMMLIVTIHMLIQGGLTESAQRSSVAYGWLIFCQAVAYCCVNCYALISGYVGVKSNYRYYKTVSIWLQTVFYSVSISVLFAVFSSEPLTADNWLQAFFPVTKRAYWYITAYIGLSLFIPFINKMLLSLSKKELYILGTTIFLLFSVLQIIGGKEIFITNKGYSLLWLVSLYILGACVRLLKIDEYTGRTRGMLLAVLGIAVSFISEYVPTAVLGEKEGLLSQYNYVYFSVLLASLGLLIFCSQLRITRKSTTSFIKFFAPLTLGVYLIHTQPLIWDRWLEDRFEFLIKMPLWQMIPAMLGCIAAIYFCCSFIDYFRSLLEKKIGLKNRLKNAETKIEQKIALKLNSKDKTKTPPAV